MFGIKKLHGENPISIFNYFFKILIRIFSDNPDYGRK